MPKISIIIPVFNVEKYLNRCIESIANQTFTDFECILVDDCSKDKSADICDDIVKKDNRFIVIHKPQNEGCSKARKSGLDKAKGEFVIHIDSDDWMELNAVKLLIEKQIETNADIVLGGLLHIYNDNIEEYLFPEISKDIFPLEYFFYTQCRNQGKFVRKNLYDDVIIPHSFSMGDMGEDAIYNIQIFSKLSDISQIAKLDCAIYNYDRQNENSITHITTSNYKKCCDDPRILCRVWVEEYLKSINVNERVLDAFRYYMIEEGVIYSIRHNKLLSQKDMKTLYKKYYVPFLCKDKLNSYSRTLIEIFNISVTIGRFCIFARSILRKIKIFIENIKF
jgi:glycosyltransferase involved in cell wall biosynthesis